MAQLTWQEKLKQGLPLTDLEQVKYDAERITLRRLQEQKEEQVIAEERKLAKFGNPEAASALKPENSKKGN